MAQTHGSWITGTMRPVEDRARKPRAADLSRPWASGLIIRRFDEIADRFPDRIAIDDGVHQVSFAQLRRRAQGLAKHLAEAPDTDRPVAAVLSASALYPTALLAALAAGRPLVPVDLSHPIERKRAILEQAMPALVLVQPGLSPLESLLPDGVPTLEMDLVEGETWPIAGHDPLAGVAFTSGSMGRPKGLAYRQSDIFAMAAEHIDVLAIADDDVVLSLASLGAGGNQDILSGLLTGARVRILDLKAKGIGETLAVLQRDRVTLLSMIPLVLRSLMQQPSAGQAFSTLRAVTTGGDRLYGEDIKLFRQVLPDACAIRMTQGATETGVVFHWIIPKDRQFADRETVPSGYVGAASSVLLVQPEPGEAAAAGEGAELMVSGPHLAAGSWQNGRLSPGPFITDPTRPEVRMYDSGDVVRRTAEGLFQFVGRRDRQIKMRGLRGDPAEVENALRKCPDVVDVAVIPRYRDAEAMFIAYAVPASPYDPPTVSRLRAFLAGEVPPHMVPAEVRFLPVLPRLANYKTDFAALIAMDQASVEASNDQAGPSHSLQAAAVEPAVVEAVSLAWTQVLGTAARGKAFDQAGGDSLKLLQLAMHLEELLNRRLPLDLFELATTEARLARSLAPRAVSRAADTRPLIFLCPGLGGDEPRLADFRRRLGRQVRFEVIDHPDLKDSVADLQNLGVYVQRALDRILSVSPDGPIALAGYSAGGIVAFELARRLADAGRRPWFVGLIDLSAERRDSGRWTEAKTTLREDATIFLSRAKRDGVATALKDRIFVLLVRWRAFGLLRQLVLTKARISGWHSVAFVRKILLERMRGPAMLSWRPALYAGPVVLFRAELQDTREPFDLGWSQWVSDLMIEAVPGDHHSMLLSPQVERLADGFAAAVANASVRCLPDSRDQVA